MNKHYVIFVNRKTGIGTHLSDKDIYQILGKSQPLSPKRLQQIKGELKASHKSPTHGRRVNRWLEVVVKLYDFVPSNVYEALKSLAFFMGEHASGKKFHAMARFAFVIAREYTAQQGNKLPITVFEKAYGMKITSKELFAAKNWLQKHGLITAQKNLNLTNPTYELALTLATRIEYEWKIGKKQLSKIISSYKKQGIIPRVDPERGSYIMILSGLKELGFTSQERLEVLSHYVTEEYKDKLHYLEQAQKRFRSYHKLNQESSIQSIQKITRTTP